MRVLQASAGRHWPRQRVPVALILLGLLAAGCGSCGDPCHAIECYDGEICIEGRCVTVTDDCDPACEAGEVCVGGVCYAYEPRCDPACSVDEECVAGECVPVGPGACDPPCEVDEACVDGRCIPINLCVCATVDDCCDGCLPREGSCDPGVVCADGGTCNAHGVCEPDVVTGFCFIDGVCHANGELDPSSECRRCDVELDAGRWSNEDDGKECAAEGGYSLARACGAGLCVPLVAGEQRVLLQSDFEGDDEEMRWSPHLRAYRTSGIALDGDLSDFGPEGWVALDGNHWHDARASGDEATIRAKVAARWSSEGLFIGVEVTDPLHYNIYASKQIFKGDSVQVAFDTGMEGGTGYDSLNDHEVGFALVNGSTVSHRWRGPPGAADTFGAVVRREGQKTYYELHFPPASLPGLALSEGTQTGLSFLVNEAYDETRRGWLEWTRGMGAAKVPGYFGVLTLVGDDSAGGAAHVPTSMTYFDESFAYGGSRSITIQNEAGAAGKWTHEGMPVSDYRSMEVSGHVRLSGASEETSAVLAVDFFDGSGVLVSTEVVASVNESSSWSLYRGEVDVPVGAQSFGLSFELGGAGEAWLDEVAVVGL